MSREILILPKTATTFLRGELIKALGLILAEKLFVVVLLAVLIAHVLCKVVVQHAVLIWLWNCTGNDGEEAQGEQDELEVLLHLFCVLVPTTEKILESKQGKDYLR